MDDAQLEDRLAGLFVGGVGPIAVAGALVGVRGRVSVADVALALVLVVLLAAQVGGRQSGIVAAVVATASLDFFHTRPYLSLKVGRGEDLITVGLLLVVGVVVGGLAAGQGRERATAASNRQEVIRLHRVAEFVASGADADDVRLSVQAEIAATLTLAACTFEGQPAGGGGLPRLERSGAVVGRNRFAIGHNGSFELPAEGVELVVVGRGAELGRFVCIPTKGEGVALEQRLAAITLADQLGSVLDASAR